MVQLPEGPEIEMAIHEERVGEPVDGYRPITLVTDRGEVELRHYAVPATRRGLLCVGGIGGDWDSPARQLYPRLCEELQAEGIAAMRVRFRHPTQLEESVLDLLAGIDYMERGGIEAIAAIGHSFGGAVAIQAAAGSMAVRSVVTLATRAFGAEPAATLGPRCSLLLIHGTADETLPPSSSQYVYDLAREPKKLVLYKGADHGLDEVADEVHRVVRQWVVERLDEALQSIDVDRSLPDAETVAPDR